MRIDEITYNRIIKATAGLEYFGNDLIRLIRYISQELGEHNYEIFSNFANCQRDIIIDTFLSLKNLVYYEDGILDSIRSIPNKMNCNGEKLNRYINSFCSILDDLVSCAERIPVINTDTSNPLIPNNKDTIYEDIYILFKKAIHRDYCETNYNLYMIPKKYSEDDLIGDLVTTLQECIINSVKNVVLKMEEEFKELGLKIGAAQNKILNSIDLNQSSSLESRISAETAHSIVGIKKNSEQLNTLPEKPPHEKSAEDWVSVLTDDEYNSVSRYTEDSKKGYIWINQFLRTRDFASARLLEKKVQKDFIDEYKKRPLIKIFSNPTENIVRDILNIDRALGKASLPIDMTLYRGINKEALRDIISFDANEFSNFENMYKDYKNYEGKVIQDRGFMSTSLRRKIGSDFSGDFLLVIDAPKGTPGVYIKNLSHFKQEEEVLIQRESLMRITSVRQENDKTVIYAKILI